MSQPTTGADNTLIRSIPCERCGARMLWTQAVWTDAGEALARAAYRCDNGHVLDPRQSPQCPNCGVHDTASAGDDFKCNRCSTAFTVPR